MESYNKTIDSPSFDFVRLRKLDLIREGDSALSLDIMITHTFMCFSLICDASFIQGKKF